MSEKFIPEEAQKFTAPKEEKPLLGDDDELDGLLDDAFENAESGEMIQKGKAEELEPNEDKK